MNLVPFILILLSVFYAKSIVGQSGGDQLYDDSFLHEIRFESATIPDSNNLWNAIITSSAMVTINIDGVIIDSVNVRQKGMNSATSPQKPLKIDVNEYLPNQNYDGIKNFNLHNNFMDSYMQRERLAHELYRRAGVPSPRTAYAEVYVGGAFKGIYSITEEIDKKFLKHNFPSKNGSLYKGTDGFAGVAVETQKGTYAEFSAFQNDATASNLGSYVHLKNYLKLLAIDIIIEDFDSYANGRHNFFIYYETKSAKLNFIPWDHNYAFPSTTMNLFYPTSTYPSATNFATDPLIKPLYEETMCELLTYLIDPIYISSFVMNNYNIINSNTNGVIAASPTPLIQYIASRKQWLEGQLTAKGISCGNLSLPINLNDIVINEFVSWTDSIGGVQEPDGGTPDWIELYNNSSSPITLDDHYYLSDDKDFPKKWYFPQAVTIPGNDYLIVWADKDVHQQGLHAGFKLEKDGGDLFMTYDDLAVIDTVTYNSQSLNQGYARNPNGIGNFVIQAHTFNANNNQANSINNISELEPLVLYPNPVKKSIMIKTKQSVDFISIINAVGEGMREIKKPTFPLSVDYLSTGVYFLQVHLSNNERYFLKIIKE